MTIPVEVANCNTTRSELHSEDGLRLEAPGSSPEKDEYTIGAYSGDWEYVVDHQLCESSKPKLRVGGNIFRNSLL
ncbi:hypothetical protein N7510_002683 [Penicillium lagena]|uniref:uncharacterized protein n=1 Tax=Penicillium lagena TaxID=94218 RepID=UPI002541DD53|nr:uncharacterized protein N7510_002683 [Penicillium lagena]KAJ5626374.1 hypothetical protein N7510_002683 [Penicillium lagena]